MSPIIRQPPSPSVSARQTSEHIPTLSEPAGLCDLWSLPHRTSTLPHKSSAPSWPASLESLIYAAGANLGEMEGKRENQSQRLEGWRPGSEPLAEAVQLGGSAWTLGKLKPPWWEGKLSRYKCLCSGNGVQGRWGVAQSLRTGGDTSWRMQGQKRGGNSQDSC